LFIKAPEERMHLTMQRLFRMRCVALALGTLTLMNIRLWHGLLRIRAGTPATLTDRLVLQLGPIEPVLLALSAEPLPAPTVSGPAQAALGDLVTFRLGLDGPASAAAHVVRLEVVGPTGRDVPVASGTVRVPPGGNLWHLPLALGDMRGHWQVRVTDVVSGRAAVATLEVH
jgi:hypothetical protein